MSEVELKQNVGIVREFATFVREKMGVTKDDLAERIEQVLSSRASNVKEWAYTIERRLKQSEQLLVEKMGAAADPEAQDNNSLLKS